MFATPAAAHRAGAVGVFDFPAAQGHTQPVRLGHRSLAPGPERSALNAQVEHGSTLEVAATQLEIPRAHPGGNSFFPDCGHGFRHDPSPVGAQTGLEA